MLHTMLNVHKLNLCEVRLSEESLNPVGVFLFSGRADLYPVFCTALLAYGRGGTVCGLKFGF